LSAAPKYEKNPIVGHISGNNRDPKVIWYQYRDGDKAINETAKKLGGHWVMILYIEPKNYVFMTSTNLKDWERTGTLNSYWECPELFELTIENPKPGQKRSKWIHYGGSAVCITGEFDGKMFVPEKGPGLRISHGGNFYASQSFNDVPAEDGRRIIVGWAGRNFKGTGWNQMLSLPVVTTLRNTESGLRLFVNPPKDLERLRAGGKREFTHDRAKKLDEIKWPLLDIEAEIDLTNAEQAGINIRGFRISYEKGELDVGGHKTPLPLPPNKRIKLRIFVDNGFIDVFANDGYAWVPRDARYNLTQPITTEGDGAKFKIAVHQLGSIWQKPAK